MSSLRTKYFSISQGEFVDIGLTAGSSGYNPVDVDGGSVNDETIRVIPFFVDLTTADLAKLVSDLLFNDVQNQADAQKVSRLLTDGYFNDIEKDFELEVLGTDTYGGDTYITKFAMLDGQYKVDNTTYLKQANEIIRTGNIASASNQITALSITSDLSVGMVVRGQGIPLNTTITSILTAASIEISNNATQNLTGIQLSFREDEIFEVGNNIDNITSTGVVYPRWRRDVIEVDKNGNTYVIKGNENTIRPPVDTQLSSAYIIESIENVSTNVFRLSLRPTSRTDNHFDDDLVVGEKIELRHTIDAVFDGVFEITSVQNTAPYHVDVIVPDVQGSSFDQTEPGGIIWLDRLALYSLLVTKPTIATDTLIVDEIENISEPVGLSGTLQLIYRDELNRDIDGLYGFSDRKRIHVRNEYGQLLDWEHGQSDNVDPLPAFQYSENEIGQIDETQLPQPSYQDIADGVLTSWPLNSNSLADNLFNGNTVDVDGVMIAVKNTPSAIGDEGIALKISTADAVWNVDDVQTVKNGSPSTTILVDNVHDFDNPVESYTVTPGSDYVLITDGPGQYQIGKITAKSGSQLTLSGITKPFDNTSTYTIFKAGTELDVVDANKTITNAQLKSQVISGVNGRFGTDNQYSKVYIDFDNPVSITLGKWYFVRVRGENEGVTWGQLPYVVVEKPEPASVGDNETRNGFFELYYNVIQGAYPSGALLLEDEFGDLSTDYPARAKAPHFRPTRYQLTARALDISGIYDLAIPTKEDVVFVDVHTGRVRFYDNSEPRRLYATYYKIDTLSGDATESIIKSVNRENFTSHTLQGKINQIDNYFEKGAEFKRSNNINGILPYDSDGFKGPFKTDAIDPNEITYRDQTNFNNHDVQENKYLARLSRGTSSDIIAVRDGKLIVRSGQNYDNSVINGVAGTSFDYPYKAPATSLNHKDEAILLQSTNINTEGALLKKKFDSAPEANNNFNPDSSMLNTDNAVGIDGEINDIKFYEYDRDIILRCFLSKNSFYNTVDYPFNSTEARKFKEREIIKVLEENLRDQNSNQANIISEKYLTDQNSVKSGVVYQGEYYAYPYAEIIKAREYEPIKSADIASDTVLSENVVVYDAISRNNKVATIMADPASATTPNRGRLIIQDLTKNTTADEYKEFDTLAAASVNILFDGPPTSPSILAMDAVKAIDLNDEYFAIVYAYDDGVDRNIEAGVYKWSDGTLVGNSRKNISNVVDSQYRFDAKLVAENTIAICWKENASTTSLSVYEYDPVTDVAISSDEVLVTSQDILESPSVVKFSRESFLVFFSYTGSLRVRKYSITGVPQFFDDALTVDFLELTTNTLANGYFVRSIEMTTTNDIVVAYSDLGSGAGLVDLKINKISEYDQSLGTPYTILSDVAEVNRPQNLNLVQLNDDFLVLTFINASDEIEHHPFTANLKPCFKKYVEVGVTNRTVSKPVKCSEHGYLLHYNEASTDLKTDLMELRPDITNYIELNGSALEIFNSGGYDDISVAPTADKSVVAYARAADGHVLIKMIDVLPKDGVEEIGSFGELDVYDGSSGAAENVDAIVVNYTGSNAEVHAVVTAYTIAGGSLRANITLINDNNTFTDLATFTIDSDGTNVSPRLFYVGNEKLLCAYINSGGAAGNDGFNLKSISLHELDSLSPAFTSSANTVSASGSTFTDANGVTQASITGLEYNITTKEWDKVIAALINTGGGIDLISFDTTAMTWTPGLLDTTGSDLDTFQVTSRASNGFDIELLEADSVVAVVYRDNTSSEVNITFADVSAPATLAMASNWLVASDDTVIAQDVLPEISVIASNSDDGFTIYTRRAGGSFDLEAYVCSKSNFTLGNINVLETFEIEGTGTTNTRFAVRRSDLAVTNVIAWTNAVSGVGIEANSHNVFPLNESLAYERVYKETDALSNTTARTYGVEAIKIGGIRFNGKPIPSFYVHIYNTFDMTSPEYVNGTRTYSSLQAGVNIVKVDDNNITVVYNSSFNQSENKILMRHYVIENDRIYEDSEVKESANFDFTSVPFVPINLHAVESTENPENVVLAFIDPENNNIPSIARVDREMQLQGEQINVFTLNEDVALVSPTYEILAFGKSIAGYTTSLIYSPSDDVYWMHILKEDREIIIPESYFTISLYGRNVDNVSQAIIDQFGHVHVSYINSGDLYYHQFGYDGDKWGFVQVLGKTEFTHASVLSDGPEYYNIPSTDLVKKTRGHYRNIPTVLSTGANNVDLSGEETVIRLYGPSSGAVTINFSGLRPGVEYTIMIKRGGTETYTFNGVIWNGGAAPTLASAADDNIYRMIAIDYNTLLGRDVGTYTIP